VVELSQLYITKGMFRTNKKVYGGKA